MFSKISQKLIQIGTYSALVFISMFAVTTVYAQVDTTKPTNGDNGGFVLCGNT